MSSSLIVVYPMSGKMPVMSSSSLSSSSLYYRSLLRLVERKKKVKKDNLTITHSNSEELVTDINAGQQQFTQPIEGFSHDVSQLKKGSRHHKMDRIRRSFRESFRRRMSKQHFGSGGNSPGRQSTSGSANNSVSVDKAELWQPDEAAVRNGTCSFNVKYLGGIEVFESRGMQICEGALKLLRGQRRPPIKAILYVSGDGLRVVDQESNRGLIVDQTIEKVSFCAPDRNHEKGFAYICRDGTSRRWMCHGFHTTKESGERLSHAVGCAFAICLERKKKRDAEATAAVQAAAGLPPIGAEKSKKANFTLNEIAQQMPVIQTSPTEREINNSSFRRLSITERLRDPQTAIIQLPPPATTASSHVHITPKPRPVGNPLLFEREGSLRAPASSVNNSAAFRRRFSLRCCPDFTNNWQQQVQSQTVLRKNEPIFEDEEDGILQNGGALNEKTTFEYAPYDAVKFNGFRQSLSYTATPPNTTDLCNTANSRSTINSPVQMQTNCSLNASELHPWPSNPVSSCSLRAKSKADEWLEQTLRSSLSVCSPHRNVNDENKTKNVIGKAGSLPGCSLPPPPSLSATCDAAHWSDTDNKTLQAVGPGVTFFNDFMQYEPSSETINFAHLTESTALPSTSKDPEIDVFGQPVFTPLSPKAGVVQERDCMNGLTADVGALKPEEPDPFGVRWFKLVVNAAKTDTVPVRSTNPFYAELNAVAIQ